MRVTTAALFVDFDNIYSQVSRLEPQAAEAFATSPDAWLEFLQRGEDDDGPYRRRFLIRRCYLNPATWSRYRPFFTNAGFSVVDCPSLTKQNKSSADIHMVLGAVDALAAATEYEEFVLLTSDADFTPLAFRIRAANRRLTVVTAGPSAPAYRAVADTVLRWESLIEHVATAVPEQSVDPADLEPKQNPSGGQRGPVNEATNAQTRAVIGALTGSPGFVQAALVAQRVLEADPSLAEDWGGNGRFSVWLSKTFPHLVLHGEPPPGWVLDPAEASQEDLPRPAHRDWSALQEQIITLTDTPRLTREEYRALHLQLAQDLKAHPFHRNESAKRVRNELQLKGHPVGRGAINYVISGLLYSGFDFDTRLSGAEIAMAWAAMVIDRCRALLMEMTESEESEARTWLTGGLEG